MHLILFEDPGYANLLPLVYSRATFNLHCGFDNLLAKIEAAFGRTADALFVREQIAPVLAERQKRPVNTPPTADDQLWINGRLLVREEFELPPGTAAWQADALLAARLDAATAAKLTTDVLLDPARLKQTLSKLEAAEFPGSAARLIDYPWQLIHENAAEILRRFVTDDPVHRGRIDKGVALLKPTAIAIGERARLKPGVVLDAEAGPIHVGDDCLIGPNATITGPCYIGESCVIKPGAHVAASSIGPWCKIGGEVEGAIFHAYANKQHDGFVGHSYVGEWVNLGAGTVTSDLKNTYGPVKVPINGRLVDSGEMFVGAFLGDHAKTGIHTTLPTGCVIGYAANVFTSRHPPKFLPSFSWLTDAGMEVNDPLRAVAVARMVMSRRNRELTPAEEALFLAIAEAAKQHESQGGTV